MKLKLARTLEIGLFAALMLLISTASIFAQTEEAPQGELTGGLTEGGLNVGFSLDTFSENQELWTALNLTPEIPLWDFIFSLDFDLFLDSTGQLSDRNWNFSSPGASFDTVMNIIDYVSFGSIDEVKYGEDIFYAKFGNLDSITFGHPWLASFTVDNYENNPYKAARKKHGIELALAAHSFFDLQFEGFIDDYQKILNTSFTGGARLSLQPIPFDWFPLRMGLSFITDLDQHSESTMLYDLYNATGSFTEEELVYLTTPKAVDSFQAAGTDLYIQIGDNVLLYGQGAAILEELPFNGNFDMSGWGIGAPGILAKAGSFIFSVEYRMRSGNFTDLMLSSEYEQSRLSMSYDGTWKTFEDTLTTNDLMGAYGRLFFSAFDFIDFSLEYQYLFPMVAGENPYTGFAAVASLNQAGIIDLFNLNRSPGNLYAYYFHDNALSNGEYIYIYNQNLAADWGLTVNQAAASTMGVLFQFFPGSGTSVNISYEVETKYNQDTGNFAMNDLYSFSVVSSF